MQHTEGEYMRTSRRNFLKSAASCGVFFIPATRLFGQDLPKLSKQMRFAGIGVGGMGTPTCDEIKGAGGTITALCDVDPRHLQGYAKHHPGIPCFTDWRKLFAEKSKEFDAVAISTPDHTHAQIALEAMMRGKHVYVQKPLARTFEECQLLLNMQKKTGVVTQMGNQGHPGVFRYEELLKEKFWGNIVKIEAWSDRPIWPQGMTEYPTAQSAPEGLDWDVWCGPSPDHGFSSAFHGFNWRGWWDYGCGAIGDMAVHNADPAFWIFRLGLPTEIKAKADAPATIAYPKWSEIEMKFGPTRTLPRGVTFKWYDGGHKPPVPDGCNPGFQCEGNGLFIHGTKAVTVGGSHASAPLVCSHGGHPFNDATRDAQRSAREIVKRATIPHHYKEFVEAARDGRANAPNSRLAYAAPFTQALLLGCIALRFPGETLRFSPREMRFINKPQANEFLRLRERESFSFAKYRKATASRSSTSAREAIPARKPAAIRR